jgi:hypothetical protein
MPEDAHIALTECAYIIPFFMALLLKGNKMVNKRFSLSKAGLC